MTDRDPEDDARVKAAVDRLPERSRRILYLNQVEKMSYVEIAKHERIFVWQVRRHMRRVLRTIAMTMR